MLKFLSQLYFFQPRTFIKVNGDDAFSFLQGQFTNELRQSPGGAIYGLWLNQKGKVIADSHVLRKGENEFLLLSTNSPAAVIMQRLEQYIIADDVTLEDKTENVRGLALWGEKCSEAVKTLLDDVPPRGQFLQKDDLLVFAGRRISDENYEIVGPEESLNGWRKRLLAEGCVETDANAAEFARIASGMPAIPQDIGPADLPNEAELEKTAISFTKGCYLGQEIMARLKNMGQVRRQLKRMHGMGEAPKTGAQLFQADKKVGEIRSAVSTSEGFVALAILTRAGLNEHLGFSLEPTGQTAQKTTVWMS